MAVRAVSCEGDGEARFETKVCSYQVGAESFDILQVMDGYALLDDAEDSKIPYWAEIWPSAIALSEAILNEPTLEGQMYLELGAGLGLASCVAAHRGARDVATDYLAEPLAFAKVNGHLNGVSLDVEMLNWLKPPPLRRFDTILAADILYSESNVKAGRTAARQDDRRYQSRTTLRSTTSTFKELSSRTLQSWSQR